MSEIIDMIQFDIKPSLTDDQIERALLRVKKEAGRNRKGDLFQVRSRYSKASFWIYALAVIAVIGWGGNEWRKFSVMSESVSIFKTLPGESAVVQLADGSEVFLNVSSVLSVPAGFGVNDRKVNLTGEAYFKVHASSKSPFTVVTPNSTAKVLGTEFVVRDYPDAAENMVAVKNGRVVVDEQVISAGERLVWNRRVPVSILPVSRTDFAFKEGELVLDDLSLEEAVPMLNRWYGAEVVIGDDGIKSLGIGGTVAKGSVQDLALILKMTYKLNVIVEGSKLTLYRGRNE